MDCKKILLFSIGCLYGAATLASHGAWPLPPEGSATGTYTLYSDTGAVLETDALTAGQALNAVSLLGEVYGSGVPTSGSSIDSIAGQEIFGMDWLAHDVIAYSAGAHSINGTTLTVPTGHVGMHFLWDIGQGTTNVDVFNVWSLQGVGTSNVTLTPIDLDGDGIPGMKMTSGAFAGSTLTMSFTAIVPVPATVWLFCSGLFGLIGTARYKKAG